jgi:protein phosphatase
MGVRHAARTDIGRRRAQNEDRLGVFEVDRLFVVADGMGDRSSGDRAASVAVDVIGDVVHRERAAAPLDRLSRGIELANARIRAEAGASARLHGMATTVVAAIIEEGIAHIAHVGDSRAYLLRQRQLVRLTKDHSVVHGYMEAVGGLSEDEQRRFPLRKVLTRAVGVHEVLEVDRTRAVLDAGDRLLLCSDGLHGMVDDRVLHRCLLAIADADEVVTTLIDCANRAGGIDNISAVVVERRAELRPPAAARSRG